MAGQVGLLYAAASCVSDTLAEQMLRLCGWVVSWVFEELADILQLSWIV